MSEKLFLTVLRLFCFYFVQPSCQRLKLLPATRLKFKQNNFYLPHVKLIIFHFIYWTKYTRVCVWVCIVQCTLYWRLKTSGKYIELEPLKIDVSNSNTDRFWTKCPLDTSIDSLRSFSATRTPPLVRRYTRPSLPVCRRLFWPEQIERNFLHFLRFVFSPTSPVDRFAASNLRQNRRGKGEK